MKPTQKQPEAQTTSPVNRRHQIWPITRLKPHPRQAELFGEMSGGELAALAEDIRVNGLIHAVEILPDGTIIAGHQRVRAVKSLGWEKVRCWLRVDLELAGAAAVEERLIADNLFRRQLNELQIARCYRELKLLEQEHPSGDRVRGDVRDQLAKRFRYSGRQLDRLTKLLELPIEIQQAYSARQLSLVAASKIVALPKREQKQIAIRIARGDDIQAVAREYLSRPAAPSKKVGTAVNRYIRSLARGLADLDTRLAGYGGRISEGDRAILRRTASLVKRLLLIAARHANRPSAETAKTGAADKQVVTQRAGARRNEPPRNANRG